MPVDGKEAAAINLGAANTSHQLGTIAYVAVAEANKFGKFLVCSISQRGLQFGSAAFGLISTWESAGRIKMTSRTVSLIAAMVEITAGAALIANPSFVVRLLIGTTLSDGGIAIGRVGGFGLLSLGLACWPSGAAVTVQAAFALFTYNLLAALYIGSLGVVGGFTGLLLWPACALHALLALLLARPAYQGVRREWVGVQSSKI